MADKILCRAIVEVVGKPKEHVEKAINLVVEKSAEIKGLKIEKKDIAKTKSIKSESLSETEKKIQEKTGEIFSSFTEIEFIADNLDVVASFCFDFLPSSLEIIEPENISSDIQDISKLMNDTLSRLHNADLAVKRLNLENSTLKNNAMLLLRNMILVSLKSKEKDIEKLSKAIGIPSGQLKPFIDSLISENFVEQEGNIYRIKK